MVRVCKFWYELTSYLAHVIVCAWQQFEQASTINFWICRISRLFVFFFSKYIFVSFQAVIQLALVTFVIDDWFSKVTSISRTFNIITMLVRVYSGTNLLWYELTIKPMNQLIDPENDWTEVSYRSVAPYTTVVAHFGYKAHHQ
jgi:hypothetical protein